MNYDYYDKIGFIGGELFGDQIEDDEVFREFYKLFELCIYLLQNKKRVEMLKQNATFVCNKYSNVANNVANNIIENLE